MTKRPSAYYRPASLDQALELLKRPDTRPLAGGTKLLAGHITDAVVDLQDLPLDGIELLHQSLVVGAIVRLTDLDAFLDTMTESGAHSQLDGWPGLIRQAIRQAGPNTYRNMATLGGSIAARLADSELLAVLLVLDAEIAWRQVESGRMPLTQYLKAEARPEGLITEARLQVKPGRGASERVARTPADYPIVSVCAWAPEGGSPRLAATGIDARPARLEESEAALAEGLHPDTIERAAAAARAQTRHPGDFRGDAGYRAEMASVLTKRVLARLS